MTTPGPRPEAVEHAAAYVAANRPHFTLDALESALRDEGYSEAEIAAAIGRPAIRDEPAQQQDLRGRAAAILIVGFLVVWGLVSLYLLRPGPPYTTGWWLVWILAAVLSLVGLISLAGISQSKRLRRGVEGALVGVLAIPFVLLFIVAGLCMATTADVR
jgi:hypothetical protein